MVVAEPPRRLTPRECERLQGLPDDWTAILYRSKPAADGPRYRAIGNSMAVPVVAWLLQRLAGQGIGVSPRGAAACG
jgi:DNA (cytosine-5)-methyltransferase 1